MVKFYKVKDTEIRKAVQISESGARLGVVALIGKAQELVDRGLLTPNSTEEHNAVADKWLVVPCVNNSSLELIPYDTLAEAQAIF